MKWSLVLLGVFTIVGSGLAQFGVLPNPNPSPLDGVVQTIFLMGGWVIVGIGFLLFKLDELIQKK